MNVVLWILQVLLALLFMWAGAFKLWLPAASLLQAQQAVPNAIVLPPLFLKFIGLCEVLGALGLVLPGVFKTRQPLIPLAAVGLLIIMIGAIVIGFMQGDFSAALPAIISALLLAFVAYGRSRIVPLGGNELSNHRFGI